MAAGSRGPMGLFMASRSVQTDRGREVRRVGPSLRPHDRDQVRRVAGLTRLSTADRAVPRGEGEPRPVDGTWEAQSSGAPGTSGRLVDFGTATWPRLTRDLRPD